MKDIKKYNKLSKIINNKPLANIFLKNLLNNQTKNLEINILKIL